MAEPTPPADEQPDEMPDEQAPAAEPQAEGAADPFAGLDKSDLVNLALARGVPSYEAWAMTEDELKTRVEA